MRGGCTGNPQNLPNSLTADSIFSVSLAKVGQVCPVSDDE
jgi:hypothetical protein